MSQTINPQIPIVGILRGLPPADAIAVGTALAQAGLSILEVPLNRPGALEGISALAGLKMSNVLVGGGTMMSVDDVDAVYAAGGRLFVAPNCNPRVIRRAADLGMFCAPGVVTPTEAFAALDSGANALKIFPAEIVGFNGLKALKSVLPPSAPLWPVGSITPENMEAWVQSGASGFGIGSNLYQPGAHAQALKPVATRFIQQWQKLNPGPSLARPTLAKE